MDGLPEDHPEHYVNLEATLCERNLYREQYENPDNPTAFRPGQQLEADQR